jgi:hypothetical protein
MIRRGFAAEKLAKDQLLLVEWGISESMGEDFWFLGSDDKKLVIFQ